MLTQRSHIGAWRAFAASPAMVGSFLLLVLTFGWMGRWEPVLVGGWILLGVSTFTPLGERIAVRWICRFRRPSAADRRVLQPAWSAAQARCGDVANDVVLWVHPGSAPNACATGRRSVAVSRGLLQEFQAGRVSGDVLTAIFVHELGHHATRATPFVLATGWLAAPSRVIAYLAMGFLVGRRSRQQPTWSRAVLAAAVVVLAAVQAAERASWMSLIILSGLAIFGVAEPVVDGALARAGERAADRYAASVGVGRGLMAAVQLMAGDPARSDWLSRVLSDHPSVDQRIEALANISSVYMSVAEVCATPVEGELSVRVTQDQRGNAVDHDSHDLLTITEAAALVRAPVATLRYWRHLGAGPCSFRLGRRVGYRRVDIDAWVAAQRDATRSGAV